MNCHCNSDKPFCYFIHWFTDLHTICIGIGRREEVGQEEPVHTLSIKFQLNLYLCIKFLVPNTDRLTIKTGRFSRGRCVFNVFPVHCFSCLNEHQHAHANRFIAFRPPDHRLASKVLLRMINTNSGQRSQPAGTTTKEFITNGGIVTMGNELCFEDACRWRLERRITHISTSHCRG